MTLSVLSDVLLLDSSPKPLLMLPLLFSFVGLPTDAERYIRTWPPLIAGDGGAVTLTGVVGSLSSCDVLTGVRRCFSTSALSQLFVAGDDNLSEAGDCDVSPDRRDTAPTDGCGILDGFDVDVASVEPSAVDLRLPVTASDDGVQPRVASVSVVVERRLSTICGNFLPLDGDITSTSPLSTNCPALELLRRGINPRPALPSCSVDVVSVVVTELPTPSSFVDVGAAPFCRLTPPADGGSPDVANCLAAVRLMDPGVDGPGMDDDDGLADFDLVLLPAAAATAILVLRLSG